MRNWKYYLKIILTGTVISLMSFFLAYVASEYVYRGNGFNYLFFAFHLIFFLVLLYKFLRLPLIQRIYLWFVSNYILLVATGILMKIIMHFTYRGFSNAGKGMFWMFVFNTGMLLGLVFIHAIRLIMVKLTTKTAKP